MNLNEGTGSVCISNSLLEGFAENIKTNSGARSADAAGKKT